MFWKRSRGFSPATAWCRYIQQTDACTPFVSVEIFVMFSWSYPASLHPTSQTGNLFSDGGEHVAELSFDTFLAESQRLALAPARKSQTCRHSVFVCGSPWPPEIYVTVQTEREQRQDQNTRSNTSNGSFPCEHLVDKIRHHFMTPTRRE